MPKSSLSTATRKKQAAKREAKALKAQQEEGANANDDHSNLAASSNPPKKPSKKERKLAKNEPRKKVYIAPSKPEGKSDPVDVHGLGTTGSQAAADLDPQIVVVLRKLNKKDEKTVSKALDDFDVWLRATEANAAAILLTLPIWLDHFPRFALHASRRIRMVAAAQLSFFIGLSSTRSAVLAFFQQHLDASAYWLMLAHDLDKGVAVAAKEAWTNALQGDEECLNVNVMTSDLMDIFLELPEFPKTDYVDTTEGSDAETSFKVTPVALQSREQTPETNITSEDEDAQSRNTRMLVAILGAFRWLLESSEESSVFTVISHQSHLWELLDVSHGSTPPVRRALWQLLAVLRTSQYTLSSEQVRWIGVRCVHAALYENAPMVQSAMWSPFLNFIQQNPNVWEAINAEYADDVSEDDSDARNTPSNADSPLSHPEANMASNSRQPVREGLYHFINISCPANPSLNFPAILVLLSNPSLSEIVTSRFQDVLYIMSAFNDTPISQAKVDSMTEIYAFLLKRIDEQDRARLSAQFASDVWSTMYKDKSRPPLRLKGILDCIVVAEKLDGYLHQIVLDLWFDSIKTIIDNNEIEASHLLKVLTRLTSQAEVDTLQAHYARMMLATFVKSTMARLAASEAKGAGKYLNLAQSIMEGSRHDLSEEALSAIDAYAQNNLPSLFVDKVEIAKQASTFFLQYIRLRDDATATSSCWTAVCNILPATDPTVMDDLISQLGMLSGSQRLHSQLPSANFDHYIRNRINTRVIADTAPLLEKETAEDLARIVVFPDAFVHSELPLEIMQLVVHQLEAQVDASLFLPYTELKSTRNLAIFCHAVAVIHPHLDSCPYSMALVRSGFKAAFLCPNLAASLPLTAADLWALSAKMSADKRQKVTDTLSQTCRDLVARNKAACSPAELVHAWRMLHNRFDSNLPLVSIEDIARLRQNFLDEYHESSRPENTPFQRAIVTSMVLTFDNRSLPGAGGDTLLLDLILLQRLCDAEEKELVEASDTLQRWISSSTPELGQDHHKVFVEDLQLKRSSASASDFHQTFTGLYRQYETTHPAHDILAESLSLYLRMSLKYASDSVDLAQVWFKLSTQLVAKDPVFSGTLLDAVSGYLQEHADMIRFQNRLASDLSGVRGSDMNKKAVPLLRLLNKTAPGRQSTASFLPEQRTVFLLRSMQAWIADDNAPDPSPELLLELVTFFGHIAPTIQSLSGTHWPFMFDIVLEMLDAESAFAQSGSLSSCCGLLETVHELCRHNKALQEQCLTGLAEVDEKLLDLFCAGSHQSDESFLLGMYLTAHTKVSLLTEARLEKLLELLASSTQIYRDSYISLAKLAIRNVVDRLTIEIEILESEEAMTAPLPPVLLHQITQSKPFVDAESFIAYFTAWRMVTFYLAQSSPRLRVLYTDQLRQSEALEKSLLPILMRVFHVQDRSQWPALEAWDLRQSQDGVPDESALALLAANVYLDCLKYLSTPVRAYYESIRNRQLSDAFSTFTERYFAVVLIEEELKPLRHADTKSQADTDKAVLNDESMSVRIASGVNEIKVVYTVDDQPLELSIRLPPNYPLAIADIRDTKKIGVSDNTWRAWVLSMQQAIASGNSRIVDALHVFKKNVELHFQNVEPCAICYSVISVTDQSKPTKKCRTCKNIFHAGCLFKVCSLCLCAQGENPG